MFQITRLTKTLSVLTRCCPKIRLASAYRCGDAIAQLAVVAAIFAGSTSMVFANADPDGARTTSQMVGLVALLSDDKSPKSSAGGGGALVICPVSCAGNFIPENEPCGVNTVNCGCDCATQNFFQLRCPEGYCAETWAFQGQHDTDWYNVHVNDSNNDGTEQVCFTVNSEFPAVVQIYTGNCGGLTLVAQGEASDCNPLTICACLPAPSFAKLKIYPGTIAGGPTNNGLPCGPGTRYTVRYNCAGVCSMGACCYQVPPICGIMTQQQCAQLPSSTWYGVGSQCTPNICQTGAPTGACCYLIPGIPGFQCTITSQTNCVNNLMGTYYGNGSVCTAALCPQSQTGACCYLSATGVMQCIQTTQQDCEHSYFGTYYGNGSICTPAICQPLTGACCYQDPLVPGFLCNIMTATQCASLNGTYLGNGSVCNPNPCEPTGACCYLTTAGVWQCVQTTASQCAQYPNGIYWGNGTLCANVQCNPPPPRGACCYQIAGTTIWQCIITNQADCLNNYFNGQWQGANTSCTPNPCPQQPVLGACCYRNPPPSTTHSCIVTTQQDCVNNYPGGIYQGNGTTCATVVCDPPVNGACCWQDLPNPTVFCTITTQLACLQNYPNSSWQGANTTCNPNPCIPTGACCYFTATGPQCSITTQSHCLTLPGGMWLGIGSSCNPNPCIPKGACCYLDPVGYQCAIVTQQDCLNQFMGIWLGPNTTCNPNPCIPTGACCYQQADNLPYTCTVVTQQQCATLPNSIWYGANTSCSQVTCPQTGACCYTIPGVVGTFCAMTTQQQCIQNLHGVFMGLGVQCTNNPCPHCVKPPTGMVSWYTLDEIAGGIARDAVGSPHGAYMPTPGTGPTPVAGFVDGGLFFDGANDYVQVPAATKHNFNCGPFSIDAWINPQSYGGMIVRKMNNLGRGYEFYVAGTGQLALGLGDGTVSCAPHFSTGTVALNTWTHVAVTASGGPPNRNIRFYINGVLSGSSNNTTCFCLGNTAPLRIGSAGNFSHWRGRLDEIELFKRVISLSEVQSIYNAGNLGKCKTRCHVPWDHPFCLNQNQVTVPVTICNDSPFPYSYNVSFQPLGTGPNCTIPGPTVFTPLFSNPVNVPANQCVTVQVTINRPVGMNALNQVACYQVNVLNLATGLSSYCQGSVQDRRDLCAVIGPCCIGTDVGLPVGTSMNMSILLTNTSPVALNIPFMVKAMNSDDMMPSEELRLNGLPPGTRYIGNLTLQPNGSAPVSFAAQYLEHHALGFDDIVLSTDTDGDGNFEALISIGTRSIPITCDADIAPVPVGNGVVDIDDLVWVITHWGGCPQPCIPGSCPGDTNGDCVVNIDDLVKVITAWGACP